MCGIVGVIHNDAYNVILDGLKEYSALPIVNETNEFSKDKKRDFKKENKRIYISRY